MVAKAIGVQDAGSKPRFAQAGPPSPAPRRAAKPAKPPRLAERIFDEELGRVAAALEEGVARRDLAAFYQTLRATHLPAIVEFFLRDPRGLSRVCFDILHRIGSISPATAVALENHFYVLATLATFPIDGNPGLEARRQAVLQRLLQGRLLVANTNFRVHRDKVASRGAKARRDGDGFRVSGTGGFVSLAGEGDLLFFAVVIDDVEPAIFLSPLRDNPGIEVGPLFFPQAMVDSDTRRITMHDHFVTVDDLLISGRGEEISKLTGFQFAWHQALLTAPFLGAAARAIEEARKFLRTVRAANDRPLAEVDGVVAEVGRLAVRYRAACCFAHQAGELLDELSRRHPQPLEIADAVELACAAKRTATQSAEEIVGEARRIIGPRVFTGGHPLERLSAEVMFGPLVGELGPAIDRRYGSLVLGESDFMARRW